MKLTTKSEYTILAMIYIARRGRGQFIKIDDICLECGIPKKYLEQLFSVLKQSGYIKAMRGASGGYMLAKSPREISLAGIIRLMDGPIASTGSVSKYFFSHTPLEREKKVLKIFKEIRDYVSDKLEKIDLESLV